MVEKDLQWTYEELILALNCYLQMKTEGRRLKPSDHEAQDLSTQLKTLRIHSEESRTDSFRSPDAVSMQVNGFSQYDNEAPFRARPTGGSRNKYVWRIYSNEPDAAAIMAKAVLKAFSGRDAE